MDDKKLSMMIQILSGRISTIPNHIYTSPQIAQAKGQRRKKLKVKLKAFRKKLKLFDNCYYFSFSKIFYLAIFLLSNVS
jgi:hypothetical protein